MLYIPSQKQHGCCFGSKAYKDVCRLRWRTQETFIRVL